MKEENVPLALKLAFAAFFTTEFLSVVLKLQVGEIDLGSPGGAALQFVFWAGIGIFIYSFSADDSADERRRNFLRYGGILGAIFPVILIVCIALGGIVSYIAMAIAFVLCLFLGYLQRRGDIP
jgi:hypothetical protein